MIHSHLVMSPSCGPAEIVSETDEKVRDYFTEMNKLYGIIELRRNYILTTITPAEAVQPIRLYPLIALYGNKFNIHSFCDFLASLVTDNSISLSTVEQDALNLLIHASITVEEGNTKEYWKERFFALFMSLRKHKKL